ncbi:hypothetical protein Efla_003455 [Eimeria flavescens]
MNGFWGGGTPSVGPPAGRSSCSAQQRNLCEEARAAAAWLWIQSEVAAAFARFSRDLLAVHSRGLSAVTALDASRLRDGGPPPGGPDHASSAAGGGARDALNSLLLLCSESAAEASRFSSVLAAGVVKPVDDVLQPLARAADNSGCLRDPSSQVAATPSSAVDGDVQKAARRLQLAEEELTKAEASLQELRSLFGAEINSSLEQKATERISRASRLKCAAQEALQQAVGASAAKRAQGPASSASSQLLRLSELPGSARLLIAESSAAWAEAEGLTAEERCRRLVSSMLQSMRAAGAAALASQQRSTGFVLHYVKDMQLFAAAELAAAGASGGMAIEDEREDAFLPGAVDDLMRQLYPANSGAQAAAQQQTNEATLRNLLRHQEKQLQEMLKERDGLRRQSARQQEEAKWQQQQIERQQAELAALKEQRRYEAPAAGGAGGPQQPARDARPKLRKQVTIQLAESESEEENSPWTSQQRQNGQTQGGGAGELHGRADAGGSSAVSEALRLPVVNAGSADGKAALRPSSHDSPPAATQSVSVARRPIEIAWVDIQLRYEAFLLALRSIPLSTLAPDNPPLQPARQQQQHEAGRAGSKAVMSFAGSSDSWLLRGEGKGASVTKGGQDGLQWADPSCAGSLAEAIEAAADAALPPFLVRCCRLAAAAAAAPSSQGDSRQQAPLTSRTSRMSVQQIQDRIQLSKRQQQQQQQDEASGRPLGPLDWGESDLQVLAYELLLLVIYHHSQYTAAAAVLMEEEEALRSSSAAWEADTARMQQQQQQQQDAGEGPRQPRQTWRPRKSLARAMSLKRVLQGDEEEAQQQQEQQQADESHAEGEQHAEAAGPQSTSQPPGSGPPARLARKPRKSLARAMSFRLGVFHADEEDTQQQEQQQQEQQLQGGDSTEGRNLGAAASRGAEGWAVDTLGACHPFSLPLEEWRRRLAGEAGPAVCLPASCGSQAGGSLSPGALLPPRRRLQATQHWLAPSPLLQQSNEEVLMQLLQLARVCFELPSASSNKLVSLLTPQADVGFGPEAASSTSLHACDLRFRVCRLMDAWRVALCPAAAASKPRPPHSQQQDQQRQQQQHQRNARFLPGAAAAAIGRFEAAQGMRGAIRRKAGGHGAHAEKRGPFTRQLSKANGADQAAGTGRSGSVPPAEQQQLAGDLGPPLLLQPQHEQRGRKGKQRLSSAAAAKPAAAEAATAAASRAEPQKRQDPVFQSFVQRQLQLLHAAVLSRCARLLKFLLPEGKAGGSGAAGGSQTAGGGSPAAGHLQHSLPWRPVQLQQLYARERSCSDEEAFLFFLRSLLLCQDGASNPKTAPQAPAFLLYSKEETAAAIAAAAQLQLLPLRLLCCFYHMFACIFALQQLQRQQLWGEDEASVCLEEVAIRVTDYAGAPAGTGEAEPPLTWEVRTESRERGGLQLLQLLQHNMSQAASLDCALRCSLAARGSNNPTLKRLAAAARAPSSGDLQPPPTRQRRQQSLKPVANLLELPDAPSDCPATSDLSEGGCISGSELEGPERGTAPSGGQAGKPHGGAPIPGMLRSALRRPTLKALRRLTQHGLETSASAARVAAAAAMVGGGEQQPLCLPREVQLSAYWCMDVPLLLSLLLLLGRCCVDSTAANGLQLDAPSLVQGLLLVAHAAQVGTDPTCPAQLVVPAPSSAVHPMGAEVVGSAMEVITNFSDFLKRPSADGEATADEVGWLLGSSQADLQTAPDLAAKAGATPTPATAVTPPGGAAGTPIAGASRGELPTGTGAPLTPPPAPSALTVMLKRQQTGLGGAAQQKNESQRTGGSTPASPADGEAGVGDPRELLLRVRGERLALSLRPCLLPQAEAGSAEGERELWAEPTATFSALITSRLWLGADWWVAATKRGVAEDGWQCALRNSRCASFCYGLSALLPSRVELQQQEIASVQLLCHGFLVRLQQQLQDYRRHFEPQVLPLALKAWQGVVQRLLLLPFAAEQQLRGDAGVGEAQASGSAWPVVSEEWRLQMLEALRQSVMAASGRRGSDILQCADTEEGEEGEALCREGDEAMAGREGSTGWVWALPAILRGPSVLHDLMRCFIYRSCLAAAGRLLGPHVSKLLRVTTEAEASARRARLVHGDDASSSATENDESDAAGFAASPEEEEAEEDEILRGLAAGIEALRSHVQSELLLYSPVFNQLLPLPGEHPLLVVAAAQSVLLSVLPLVLRCADRAAEDQERRGLPARGGSAVLSALTAFERLTDELWLGGVLCVPLPAEWQRHQRGLVSALAPRFFAAFSLHLSGLTDLLSQAFLRDVFAPANPPHAIYSEKAIDAWCCIYGVVEAALDSSLPVRWLLPRLLQFLSELTAALCRSMTDPCMSQSEGPGSWGGRPLLPLLALRQLQQANFSSLLEGEGPQAAASQSPLAEHFLNLQRTAMERSAKQHRKSKGWRGRMTQLVTGWEEEEKTSLGVSRLGSAYMSGMDGENSESSDQCEGGPSAHAGGRGGHHRHGSPTDEDRGRSRSVFRRFFGPTGSRESSLARSGAGGGGHGRSDGEAAGAAAGGARSGGGSGGPRPVVAGMERFSAPLLQLLAAVDTLTEWEAAREKATLTGGQRPTSGLQRWLVRLHIVSLYLQRLPGLRDKLLQESEKRICVRCPRDSEAVQRLKQLQGAAGGKRPTFEGGQQGEQSNARRGKDALQRRQEEELAEATAAVDDALEILTQKLQETAKQICSLAAVHLVYYELQGDLFGSLYAGEEGFSGATLSRLLLAFPNTVEAFFCSAPVEWQDELASAVLLCLAEAWCLLLAEWGYGGHCFEEKELEVLEADLDSLRQYAADNEIAFEENADVFDRVNDFLVMLDAHGRCLAATAHSARQQQEAPGRQLAVDAAEKSRIGTPGQGKGGQAGASLFAANETRTEGDSPGTRRGRHRAREAGSESSEKGSAGRRQHSKSKGWGGVGRWVKGVYGHHTSSRDRDSSRASHRSSRSHRDS